MDICASLAPLLAGVSAAGGPPGMLVGAIFAMVGQILSFFAPKSESLTSQIETLLRKLQAEEVEQKIRAVHTNITNYAFALRNATERISTALDLPVSAALDLPVSAALDLPGLQIMVIIQIIKDVNPIEGNTIRDFWQVTGWLMEKANHNQDKWPIILAAVCRAYSDLLVTVITLLSLVSTDKMRARFDEAEKLPAEQKHEVQKQLTKLLALAIARLLQYGTCNGTQLKTLKQLTSAAQNRGMLWYIGSGDGPLYAGTNIWQGDFKRLADAAKRLAVAVSRKDIGEPDPHYHVFLLEKDRTYYKDISSPYKSQGLFDELKCDQSPLYGLSDIWVGTPVTIKNEVYFYAAKGTEICGYVLGENKEVRFVWNKKDFKSKVVSVRVVHNPKSFVDDPDENTQLPSVLKGIDYLIYGGLENSQDIYVASEKKVRYVPSPWLSYSGLGVDQHHLWVFGSTGFACATHASVMRCLENGKIPRWMKQFPLPDQLLYKGDQYNTWSRANAERPPLKGLVDLCPCDDGTLVAALYKRRVEKVSASNYATYHDTEYKPVFHDDNALYTAVYHTDLKNGAIGVDWTEIGGTNLAVRVQKQPVFCWSLIESLTAMLDVLAPAL